jgi:hypothetical protein
MRTAIWLLALAWLGVPGHAAPRPGVGVMETGSNFVGGVKIHSGTQDFTLATVLGIGGVSGFATNALNATNWTGSVAFSNAIALAWNADIDSKTNTFAASGGIIVTVAGRAVTIAVPATWAEAVAAVLGASNNWNTAYGWGNHAGLYLPVSSPTQQWNNAANSTVNGCGLGGTNIVVAGGTFDHTALSNLLWTASAHSGTVARIAGFLEGGMPGYIVPGANLELDGSDNLNVTGLVSVATLAGATNSTVLVPQLVGAGMATNGAPLTVFSSGSATTGQVATANGSGGVFWATASDASKADSNSVVTIVQTNSAGVAVSNTFTVGVANPTITLPTISAGGGGGGGATNEVWRAAMWRIPSSGGSTRIVNGDWLVITNTDFVEARNIPVYGVSTGQVMLVGLAGCQASLVWGYEDGTTNFPTAVTTNGLTAQVWSNLTGMVHGLIAARLYGVNISTNAGVKVGQ